MDMMSAARLYDPGEPFRVDQLPIPQPTGDDVLVRVRACGVVPNLNNVIQYAEILPAFPLPELPAIYGLDPAGEIAAVGPDVLELAPGQRVYVNPGRGCGSCVKCRSGNINDCASYTFAGYFGFGEGSRRVFKRYPWGGFAEYMIAPATSIAVLPDAVSFEEAARFGYLGTAYAALRRAGAGCDTSVLINGATGTLGAGAVLLALAMGAPRILAVAREPRLLEELKAVAPQRIVTHSNLDGPCIDWARAQTDGLGPDVVIEALGNGSPPEASMNALLSVGRGGRVVTIGAMTTPLPIDPIWMMLRQVRYEGSLWFTTAQAEEMARMAASGSLDLKRLVHKRFPLDQVSAALAEAMSRELGGFANVVVTP
ncbi:MAG TPA: alcohol dehydrogenase catalytic domain-containing protein [Phenylobacterium sp.]|nr:alcohol dehydrogenase catalytic domain-containing protein [Phenylobacterium sp.]